MLRVLEQWFLITTTSCNGAPTASGISTGGSMGPMWAALGSAAGPKPAPCWSDGRRYKLHMLVRDYAENVRDTIPQLYRAAQTQCVGGWCGGADV